MKPLSFASVAVLKTLKEGSRYGFDVMDAAGLPSGTVYPILGRLEERGLVRSQWETLDVAQQAKRPPRKYYEVTAAGASALASSIEHYRTLGGRLPTRRPRRAKA